jgi:trigger factor
MQVTETLSDGLKRAYTVIVPAADIEGRRAAKLSEIGRTLRLPGFRPGKVPLPVVRQRYGTAVMAEVLQESVDTATQQVLSDRGLRPAVQPKVDVVSGADAAAADLEFKVELELLPDIAMPDFAGIELVRLKAEPTAEVVDEALAEIARRQADLVDVTEDREAVAGDVLKVDFTGRIEGTPFPGGAGTDMIVEIGGAGFIPGFSEQMAGMKPGESRTIEVTFPEEYGAKELAGKAASFDITAKALQQKVTPAIDDALAAKLGLDSADKLRELVRDQMQREYDQLSRLRLKRALLDALAERADFTAPDAMVESEFGQIWQRVEADLKAGTGDEEDRAKDEATLRAEYRAIAERRVKLGLLLSEIGRVNGVTVAADEMTRAMRAEAARYPGQEAQVMEFFRKNPQAADSLRGPIFEDKVVDFVLELARLEERVVDVAELTEAEAAA